MKTLSRRLGSRLIYLVVAVGAATAGFGLYHTWSTEKGTRIRPQNPPVRSATELIGQHRPAFTLRDLDGERVSINRWDGNVVLINFWATWCPPCRKEIPEFVEILNRFEHRGFRVVGIAIDNRDAVKEFVASLDAGYPQLMGEENGLELAKRYGNHYGALPYSVLLDRAGVIRFIKPGELRREELEHQLERLL
jgi:peroxiredoxin